MKIELLEEPLIEFADDFLCDDPKKGILTTGFYSLSNNTHNSEINYSIIGTKKQIEIYNEFVEKLKNPIESTSVFKIKNNNVTINSESGEISLFEDDEILNENETPFEGINKKLNPDFPGFNENSCFKCKFQNNPDNDIILKSNEIDNILNGDEKLHNKLFKIIDLFKTAYVELIENNLTGTPDIIILIIGKELFEDFSSIQIGNKWLNFRRILKAEIIALDKNVPIQIILEDTLTGKKKSLQDLSMIAWNYCIAQYYKTANCTPWTIKDIDSDTCYLGISFHKVTESDDNDLRSSIAQAFNKDGKGLIFTGKQFEWNSNKTKVVAPHLKYDYAKELIINVLKQYVKINKHTPKRVVIHKTSDFWDSYINEEYNEVDGIVQGIVEVLGNDVEYDLVTVKSSKIRVLRNGAYPSIRGTMLKISDEKAILYTSGYVPYFNTYPGAYVPVPLQIENIGETPIKEICKEVLALTKMNFNNADYFDSLPITLQFSMKVGEIIQYMPEDVDNPPNKYYFYM
ncbi:Protein of unknown function [Flavobacterium indicum GPTSA100-9 = DSM 17447]|uniref:Protein argonaute n=1 Tax=Flavobacterium indicum (strain DSM 17447 / CIP 109464 / GPTSA100-9) TaxID=1094466 RepID=H8XNK3_FLAIG|nr:hypothetical protein [Flavobacterium indicum]CCG52120.1 Protein of unknown function [Flavobacterium indicum GPTSA100-9 = DSM 17447]